MNCHLPRKSDCHCDPFLCQPVPPIKWGSKCRAIPGYNFDTAGGIQGKAGRVGAAADIVSDIPRTATHRIVKRVHHAKLVNGIGSYTNTDR